jgi:hypothetical protein
MRLYTCPAGARFGSAGHPCGRAADALREAGYTFDEETVGGFKALPWTRRGGKRAKLRELSGQEDAPVLVLDDGSVIAGSRKISDWAKSNPAR